MSDSRNVSIDRQHGIARMELERRRSNEEVRAREDCIVCDRRCPDTEYPKKYAQAGGHLSGPFCCSGCYWRWMNR